MKTFQNGGNVKIISLYIKTQEEFIQIGTGTPDKGLAALIFFFTRRFTEQENIRLRIAFSGNCPFPAVAAPAFLASPDLRFQVSDYGTHFYPSCSLSLYQNRKFYLIPNVS
jgi:hypothetical protein